MLRSTDSSEEGPPEAAEASPTSPRPISKKKLRKRKGGPRATARPRETWKSWLKDHWIIVASLSILALVIGGQRILERREQEAERQARATEATALRRSHHARLEALRRGGGLPPALPLSDRPCPAWVPGPAALGERPFLPMSSPDRSPVESALREAVVQERALDLLPAEGLLGGPLTRRIHFDEGLTYRTRGPALQHHLSFVIESWTDPRVSDAYEAELQRGATFQGLLLPMTPEEPGQVSGRLWVWSHARHAYLCGSPSVRATTPPITLMSQIRLDTVVADRPLDKARVETLFAAIREAARRLREVDR